METQRDPPPEEGGRGLFNGSHWGLQITPGQTADGASQDHQLQGAVAHEQEERDGWVKGGEDAL